MQNTQKWWIAKGAEYGLIKLAKSYRKIADYTKIKMAKLEEIMEIMKPWSNIVTTAEENRFSISVWGRTYLFENSFLPSAIFSAGYNLLYEPALLHLQ